MKNEALLNATHDIDFLIQDLHRSQSDNELLNHMLVGLIEKAVELGREIAIANEVINGDKE